MNGILIDLIAFVDTKDYSEDFNGFLNRLKGRAQDELRAPNEVFIVRRCSNMTDGSGPTITVACFKKYSAALNFVFSQEGIMGITPTINDFAGWEIDQWDVK